MNSIIPCLWFDHNAQEAATFYTSLFDDSHITHITYYNGIGEEIHGKKDGEVMTVDFELAGENFQALNGGPEFQFTPAVSLFVTCESKVEVDKLWDALSTLGETLMPLDKYPWSERYGWVKDRYGLTWQVCQGELSQVNNKRIATSLLFAGNHYRQAEEAVKFYSSIFEPSQIHGIHHHVVGEQAGAVAHAQFMLRDRLFMAMDSDFEHTFSFNEATSLMVLCKDQKQIDYYWEKLSADGDPNAQVCGWLKDKYGVSWQIVPEALLQLTHDNQTDKAKRVTQAYLKMRKIDVEVLEKA